MRLTAGLLLLGLWGCLPELQPPSPVKTTAPSVAFNPTPTTIAASASPTSTVQIELWAGNPDEEEGFKDGQRTEARFSSISSLAIDPLGNLYMADHHRIRKITVNGSVTTIAGSGFTTDGYTGGYADGPVLEARLNHPSSIILRPNGEIWFYDNGNYMIRKINLDNRISTVLAVRLPSSYTGSIPPPFPLLGTNSCWGGDMALGLDNNVYTTSGDYICRLEVNGQVTKLAGQLSDYGDPKRIWQFDGPAQTAILMASDLAFTPQGEIYVSDLHGVIRKITKDWSTISTVAGDGKACQKSYSQLNACMYPPEQQWGTIPYRRLDCGAGCPSGELVDGPAQQAQFYRPEGIVLDPQGNLYIADSYNHAIRKLSTDGMVSTVAKFPDELFPRDIVRDKQGNFYVSTGHAIYKFRVP